MITVTPQARAIAAFTLAVLVVTGHLNRLAFAFYAVFGDAVPRDRSGQFILSLLTVVVAAAVLWIAHTAVVGAAGPDWHAHLAQAARVLAVVGLAIAVFATIGVGTSGEAFYGSFSLSF
jgi:hypothetical protein